MATLTRRSSAVPRGSTPPHTQGSCGSSFFLGSRKCSTVALLKTLLLALLVCVSVLTYLLACQFLQQNHAAASSSSSLGSSSLQGPQRADPPGTDDHPACQEGYDRFVSQATPGLTADDYVRSRAWVGNEQRLATFVRKLEKSTQPPHTKNATHDPVHVVVCGGSITLGHGVVPTASAAYSYRFEKWLNDFFPPASPFYTRRRQHIVHNKGSHGADICAMAKRMKQVFGALTVAPDMVVLEFAVNDYQGQDHKVQVDHKTDVFFDGYQQKAMCAEAVVSTLLRQYPAAAVVFLEFQTGILNRKTAQLLHLGVAQHYQIPVISYAEAMMPGYYYLLDQLKEYEYSAPIGDAVAPFPHGCAPCQEQYMYPGFRPMGCKSVCQFVQRSGLLKRVDCKNPPFPGRAPCMPPFWAHDAVHPSYVGHGIARDLLAHAIMTTQQKMCRSTTGRRQPQLQQQLSMHALPPPSFTFLGSETQLKAMTDWVMVKDTMDMFSDRDPLESKNHSPAFQYRSDGFDRKGWVCDEDTGGHYIAFDVVDLPRGCYVLYIASLKSYEGMGSYTVRLEDLDTRQHFEMAVDGSWQPRISVPTDIAIRSSSLVRGNDHHNNNSSNNTARSSHGKCTGKCTVTVTTHAKKAEQTQGNQVKIVTLSARTCYENEF